MKNSMEYIENIVCNYLKINPMELHTDSRRQDLREARQKAMTLCIESGFKHEEVGEYFERDRCTALHAQKRIGNLCKSDRVLKNEMDLYRVKLGLSSSMKEYLDELLNYRNKIDGIINFLQTQAIWNQDY